MLVLIMQFPSHQYRHRCFHRCIRSTYLRLQFARLVAIWGYCYVLMSCETNWSGNTTCVYYTSRRCTFSSTTKLVDIFDICKPKKYCYKSEWQLTKRCVGKKKVETGKHRASSFLSCLEIGKSGDNKLIWNILIFNFIDDYKKIGKNSFVYNIEHFIQTKVLRQSTVLDYTRNCEKIVRCKVDDKWAFWDELTINVRI